MLSSSTLLIVLATTSLAATGNDCTQGQTCISGIYPHLSVFSSNGECGIGAVVPWAGKLWMMTYPPHFTRGSTDKLYEIAPDMTCCIRPESVGGTHAARMIHRESKQLIVGPYFIDQQGHVRACDLNKLVGRMTAVARHLTDPANKVYYFDMEGAIYEVDVHTLAVRRLFEKPVPGWHGKGGYTSQGRLVIANNGEWPVDKKKRKYEAGEEPKGAEDAGVLAEWDGRTWRIVERRQFTDVTGPGGIYGAPDDKSPLWAIGWDRRSLLLKLLDGGQWSTFRLPKASHAYDPRHGWYTEWPRIRQAAAGRWMMTMHGMFFDFPPEFRTGHTAGLKPIASYLRYVPDFCDWNGRLVLASDDASLMANPMVGQSQSNLWFGALDDLPTFGPRSGWGGPWDQDTVKAGQPSDPYLFAGFDQRCVHLSHKSAGDVRFAMEIDAAGDGQWKPCATLNVPASGYLCHVFPADVQAAWIRVRADKDCTATAYFHYNSARDHTHDTPALFAEVPPAGKSEAWCGGLIRPAKQNRNLQFVARTVDAAGKAADLGYYELDEQLRLTRPDNDRSVEVQQIAAIKTDFEVDGASVIMKTAKGQRYRLPKGDASFDRPSPLGWPRAIRECVSERYMVNVHGTFYEMPRDTGLPLIKPVCSHGRQIADFCTWRGLMVLCGIVGGPASSAAQGQEHVVRSADGRAGVWLGGIDDLWRLGKPVGHGGPWKNTAIRAGEPSDPYLMTGFDRKRLALSHTATTEVRFTLEIDFDHQQWLRYQTLVVPPGQTVEHVFPAGFSAHWIRIRPDRDCQATAWLSYE